MPPATHSPSRTTPQGSILLIEEYDALAAAITSAFRKFAPDHEVHVARNLTEARGLTKTIEPALVVVDFDPAFLGLSPFLQKLQANQPDTRALLIAGKMSPEVSAAAHAAYALRFVEKPFDVPEFGAAVQALLGPWRESENGASRGTLQDLTLADLIVAQCAGVRTVAIEVNNGNGKSGEIQIRQGVMSHAEVGRKSGDDALEEMLGWREVQVRERKRPRITRRTIEDGWSQLLVEAFQRAKPRAPKAARKPVQPPAPAKAGKKLVVIDDTEMLLIFVEDVLKTSNPDLRITTAPNGLKGVKEVEQAKPDLVLLDYSLPDINGDEVCRRLLQSDATSNIPVLLMSGHVPEMDKAAATLDNVVATIAKPFLSDALISVVQQTLTEGRKVRKKAARKAAPATPAVSAPVNIPAAPVTPARSAAPTKPPHAESSEQIDLLEASDIPEPITHPEDHLMHTPGTPARPPDTAEPTYKPRIPASLRGVMEKARRAMEQRAKEEIPSDVPPESAPVSVTPPQSLESTPASQPPAPPAAPSGFVNTRIISDGTNEVILSLFLEVVSVQLTPELRMGAIRAKPSSGEVSLHILSPNVQAGIPQTGFKLGEVSLDGKGRIATMRLVPTMTPFKAAPTQNALQIGGVSVVPIDSTSRVQLTPGAGTPMTLQLLAQLDLAGVELSPTFQVSQIVLKDRGRPIRVTLSAQPSGSEQNGSVCETVAVRLDHAARISELLLTPVK